MSERIKQFVTVMALLVSSNSLFGKDLAFNYVFPQPGAKFISDEAHLILRSGEQIKESSVTDGAFTVTGSLSGSHTLSATLLANGTTIIVKLDEKLAPCEEVSIAVDESIQTINNSAFNGLGHSFTVSCRSEEFDKLHGLYEEPHQQEIGSIAQFKQPMILLQEYYNKA